MSDTTVVVNEAEEAEPEVIVDAGGDDAVDAVELAVEIQLVERVAVLEQSHNQLVATVAALAEQLQVLDMRTQITQEVVEDTREEVAAVAEEAAEAVTEVVEDIDEASEEIKPDEVPTVREHPFFRKWGKSRG